MRCSELRAILVSTIEGTTVDGKAHHKDVFRVADVGFRDINTAPDRICILNLSTTPVRGQQMITQDNYVCIWDLTVLYHDAPTIQDRIGDDAERLSQALEAMVGLQGDIILVDVGGGGINELEGLVASEFTVTTTYRLTAGV